MAGEDTTRSGSCCNGSMIIQIIILAIWTPISIAMIVVGAVHKNDCAAEPFIPIYLIVAGVFTLVFWLLLPMACCCPTLQKIASLLVGLFLFAWFIAGSVWVFRIYPNNERNCQRGMYLFAFSILIIQYIFIGIGVIATLLTCFCCQNSCASNICGDCLSCLECSKCCQCSSCLQSCSCLESCCCLESDSCGCMQCCDICQSLCCCCKKIQCSSCLNCSMCAQCCKCLECCSAKV